ncbi:hypothetical protein FNU76_20260 [Chitinimonas arctica]|uniref:Type VI secretion system tip protein VgrG n=1 Tax=Chitinimonas arctica TaxID=2594795 RepID=A0A516SK48_9NEIS|nr:contractile injection system protein, VgrG/Pvc8 family [Chitinimonas arctica]QDQ28503.1 hypothetical protein FNU76_20260 [Chitinimonas arctica]
MNAPLDTTGITRIEVVDAPALFLHLAIFIDNRQLIGDETFRLVSFTGNESVSEPFEYQLELHGNDQWQADPQRKARIETLRFDSLIGKPVTFAVGLPDISDDPPTTAIMRSSLRFQAALTGGSTAGLSLFNGMVAAFAMAGPGVYHLTVRPALWRLTLANRYEIYDDRSVAQAVVDVLAYHHIVPDMAAVDGLATARSQDWLQAGESDYEFLRRLMGKAHLYFYFRHGARGHELVFANRPDYPDQVLPGQPLRYTFTDTDANGLGQFDVIGDYRYQQSLGISAVHTVFTRQYQAWQVDGVPPILQFDAPPHSAEAGDQVFMQHKVYQYGNDKLAAEHFARMTMQASSTAASQLSGGSFCALFRAGFRFCMSEADRADCQPSPVRPSLEGRPFVLTRVEHEASQDGGYRNKFEATEASGLVAAFSLADTQQGSVLAVVVEHASERVPKSWKYYEKGDFDPQTQSYLDSASDQRQVKAQGVYVRLATDAPATRRWVKLAAHMQTAPEIGAQVIVSRANDESELPELQQVVQAGGNKVVTPSTWTADTRVGSGYSTRYGDGISLGFGAGSVADLGKAVNIASGAYETGRFRDAGYNQGANYGFSTSESTAASASQDLAATYGPYQSHADDLLSVNESFGSSFSRSVGQVQSGIAQHDISYNDSHFGQTESLTKVDRTARSSSTHGGDVSNRTVMQADSYNFTQVDGKSTSETTHNGKLSSTTTVNADTSNRTEHFGNVDNFTRISQVSTSRNEIGVQSNSSAIGVSNSNDVIGASVNVNLTGASSQTGMTGISSSTHLVGVSDSTSLTGVTDACNITGVSTQLSLTGVEDKLNLYGISSEISLGVIGYRYQDELLKPKMEQEGPTLKLLSALLIIL